MGGVFLAVEVNGTFLQQRPQDLQILAQVGERRAQVEAEHGPHGRPVAWTDSDAQPPRRQLVNHLRLLRHHDGMARVGGNNGSTEQDVIRLHGGGGEESQSIQSQCLP